MAPFNLTPEQQKAIADNVAKNILPFQKFRGANQYGPNLQTVGKGSLIKFYYQGIPGFSVVHDRNPVVIIYSFRNDLVKGVNIRYLTFPYIKNLLEGGCDNPRIPYNNIKGNKYIADAFRSYKRAGIKLLRRLDCDFLLKVLKGMRSFSPGEVDNMRAYVRESLRDLQIGRAPSTSKEYTGWLTQGTPIHPQSEAVPPVSQLGVTEE